MYTLQKLDNRFFDLLEGACATSGNIGGNDILCFRKSVESFLESGKKDDAFVVYFCFSEMFRLFGKGYDNTQKLLETLSDHEYHSGALLSRHRDHYSHSVYVFALGLAMYACDSVFKSKFDGFYNLSGEAAVEEFLRLWGMTALFHDIGYPFQLAHEQIKTYTLEMWGTKSERPYVSYGNLDKFLAFDADTVARLKQIFKTDIPLSNINELLAYGLEKREGYDYNFICEKLRARVKKQPENMDHGYFSAVILVKALLVNDEFELDEKKLDVLTAILLHNNLNKYDIPNAHPIAPSEHPLSYLLMLCDELQNWDRTAYGKASKQDPIAWDAEFSVTDNAVSVRFIFDDDKVNDYSSGQRVRRINKEYEKVQSGKFASDIHRCVDTTLDIRAEAAEVKKKKKVKQFASEDSFINLCDFAKAIHASYDKHCRENNIDHLNADFAALPLEFKVSNIEQAKSYSEKLELINCFYSSKYLDYETVEELTEKTESGMSNVEYLCRLEHARWVKEKLALGWKYGTDYSSSQERNEKKIHKCIVQYEELSEDDRSKDALMVQSILPMLRKFNSDIKIYKYSRDRKQDFVIAGTGHRHFKEDVNVLKDKIKRVLEKYVSEYGNEYNIVVSTCYAVGADWLIAECACEMGLATKAVIPMKYEDYIKDVIADAEANGTPLTDDDVLKMRHLMAQTIECKVMNDSKFVYYEACKYIIEKCNSVIALWDGKPLPLHNYDGTPINRGGTYHCLKLAEENKRIGRSDVHIIDCYR